MFSNKIKTSQLVFTLIFWACFLLLPFLFFPYNRDRFAFESHRFIILYIFSNVFLVAFYYLNTNIFIPKLLAYKKILAYSFLINLIFFVYLFGFFLVSKYAQETQAAVARRPNRPQRSEWWMFFSLAPIIMFLVTFTFSSVSKIIEKWFNAEETKEEISKQQLETELSLLRSQMNPHFLFNTLNGIYSLTLSNNTKASDAVMKLSRIMRYMLEESQSEYVPLQNEIAFINSYINLQKLRTTDKTHVIFETDNFSNEAKIPPLLLIPFIENAFKYGVSARQETEIKVFIRVVDTALVFSCENDIVPNISMPEGTGTGIANVQRRLELLYEDAYELNIKNENQKYKATLKLNKRFSLRN